MQMRKRYPWSLEGTIGYLCEADPSVQSLYSVSQDELETKAKLWLLLFDTVYVSAGHIVGSQLTYSWLQKEARAVERLAAQEAFLPSLRNDRDNLEHYTVSRPPTHEPWWHAKEQSERIERARFLDSLFPEAITWRPLQEGRWFRDTMLADLRTPDSTLRKGLVGVSSSQVDALCGALTKEETLKRTRWQQLAVNLCPQRHRFLYKYGDALYHTSGALEKLSFPLMCGGEAVLARRKATSEVESLQEHTDVELWEGILSAWHVARSALEQLSFDEIVQIRADTLGRNIRSTWRTILLPRQKRVRDRGFLNDMPEASRNLESSFAREFSRQKDRAGKRRRQRRRIEIGAWGLGIVATGVGLAIARSLGAGVGVGAGIIGFLCGSPILDLVEGRRGTELIVLSSRLLQE